MKKKLEFCGGNVCDVCGQCRDISPNPYNPYRAPDATCNGGGFNGHSHGHFIDHIYTGSVYVCCCERK